MNYSDYILAISARGDRYGNSGGLNSLLSWCNKNGLREVTEEEARVFFEDPGSDYSVVMRKDFDNTRK